MIELFWRDGHFSWALITSIVYLVGLLISADVAWRLTSLGGRRLLFVTAAAAMVGLWAIWMFVG